MSKASKIDDAVKFIRANGITDGTDDQLVHLIKKAVTKHGFDYVADQQGNILGLYIGEWVKPFTIFRVHLLLGRGTMLTLMKRFKARFPLLETVVTGRHKKAPNQLKSTYTDETELTEYHPTTFKLVG